MDAGFLDVLHHAGDVDGFAVADAVHVHLDRVVQVAVDQHRVVAGHPHRLAHVAVQPGAVVDDLHRAAAQHVAGADHHRDSRCVRRWPRLPRRSGRCRCPAGAGRGAAAVAGSARGPRPGRWRRRRCRGSGCRLARQRLRQLQRRLAAILDDAAEDGAVLLLAADQGDDVLLGQRLEIQPVGGVVVGADGFRVAVDHDGLEPGILQRVGGVDAAIVELDALADAVRAAAEDDDLACGRSGRPRRPACRSRLRRSNTCRAWRRRTRRRRCRCACRPG